ncbi:uncharacterized protein LOC124265070 [Haliotis rubra]|uniref:uncharacterized protein LOC124265070 n=1 Tax=Haliotis rubra TaxID=36100 RepID=UPI001EE53664|nr:uncharacterized protein LOC124265070 [Haliotis rubra]
MKAAGAPADQTRVNLTVRHVIHNEKSLVEAYILAFLLGPLGAHHFYLGRPWYGVAYFFTFGLFGVGYLVDLVRIPLLVREANLRLMDPSLADKKSLLDAYILWFPCGILGFHLFYLRKPGQGILYLMTFGLFGIGFLIDIFRMPYLVKEVNDYPPGYKPPKSMFAAYMFGLSPFGILGAHHYYLNRPFWGLLYTITLGLVGLGWLYDLFRMPCLVRRAREINAGERDAGLKHVDDVYILWFTYGISGVHHFYLGRPLWGLLYFCTLGLFGIGWLVDMCRLPGLVNDYNRNYVERQLLAQQARRQLGGTVTTSVTGQTVVATTLPGAPLMNPPNQVMMPPPYTQGYQGGYQTIPIAYQQQQGYQQPQGYQQHHGYQQPQGYQQQYGYQQPQRYQQQPQSTSGYQGVEIC